jgi:hypothetical protein
MTSNSPSEKRLDELREQAWDKGVVEGRGVDVAGGRSHEDQVIMANQSLDLLCGPGKFRFISS